MGVSLSVKLNVYYIQLVAVEQESYGNVINISEVGPCYKQCEQLYHFCNAKMFLTTCDGRQAARDSEPKRWKQLVS